MPRPSALSTRAYNSDGLDAYTKASPPYKHTPAGLGIEKTSGWTWRKEDMEGGRGGEFEDNDWMVHPYNRAEIFCVQMDRGTSTGLVLLPERTAATPEWTLVKSRCLLWNEITWCIDSSSCVDEDRNGFEVWTQNITTPRNKQTFKERNKGQVNPYNSVTETLPNWNFHTRVEQRISYKYTSLNYPYRSLYFH